MKSKNIQIKYSEYSNSKELPKEDENILEAARDYLNHAYAPYSNFQVAACILLENDELIFGTNQENAAYPSGLCAERVAMFYASSKYPKMPFKTIAITAKNISDTLNSPIFPCGSCRQVMLEYENLQNKPIRFILAGSEGKVIVIDGIDNLLPFSFDADSLN